MDSALALQPSFFSSISLISSISAAFVGGLAASFTPCVYPLITVTLAIFGATSEVSRLRAFLLSLVYVLGIAVTYTVLGMFSALSGAVFGQSLGNPYVVTVMCVFLLIMSLYTLEIVNFTAIFRIQTQASKIGGRGFSGAFLMGSVSGLVAAPCAAPILITILGIAASTQNPLIGGLLLFSYALGFGLIFIVLGTFSNLVKKVPRSGNWLQLVKFAISAALLMVVLFLLQPFLKNTPFAFEASSHGRLLLAVSVLACVVAVVSIRRSMKFATFVAACLLAFSIFHLYVPSGTNQSGLTWAPSFEQAKADAQSTSRLIMVDFFAEWCAACKEFDSITFRNPAVIERLSEISLARIDLTQPNDANDKIQEQFGIIGLPSLLFFTADGTEIAGTRIEGFMNPEEFLVHIEKIP